MAQQAGQEIQNGNFQAAQKILHDGAARYPKAVAIWTLLGIANTELGDLAAARKAFRQGLAIDSSSVPLNENFGLFLFKQADYGAAKQYLSKAVDLGSRNPGVRFSLAGARLRTGEQQKALADLVALQPDLANAAEYWEERGAAELRTNAAAAESSFDRALAIKPDSLRALNGAASAAEKQKLDEKALALLLKAREADPNDAATLMHFGLVCLRRDLGLDAVNALEKAHRLQPDNREALYLLARAYIAGQDWQHSLDLFTQFAQRAPDVPTTYYAMGWLNVKLNRPAEARRQLEHCLQLAPGITGARYELAQLDIADNRIDAAEAELRQVLQQDSHHAEANLAMADLMMRKNDLNAARRYAQKAIEAQPESAAAHYKLATIFSREHETEPAQTERAIAARLNTESNAASKTQLRIVLPENLEKP